MRKNKKSVFLLAAVINALPAAETNLSKESFYFRKIPEEWSKHSDKLYVYTGTEDILVSVQIEKSKKNLKLEDQIDDWKKTLELAKLKVIKSDSGLMQVKIPRTVVQSQDPIKKSEQFQWISATAKEFAVITCLNRKEIATDLEKICKSLFNEFRWKLIPTNKS